MIFSRSFILDLRTFTDFRSSFCDSNHPEIERKQMTITARLKRMLGAREGDLGGAILTYYRARIPVIFGIAVTAVILATVFALALPSKIMANDDETRTFTVDVAFRLPYVQNNVDPAETVKDPSAFSMGDTFIQDGTIYPEGTIPRGATDFDPDTAPGAIGVYRARGTWTTDLASFELAAAKKGGADPDLAFATEIFSLSNNRGLIMTDGTLPNAYFSARRVVLGGTRSFRDIVGEVSEENIGETKAGCNLRVTFKIHKAGDESRTVIESPHLSAACGFQNLLAA